MPKIDNEEKIIIKEMYLKGMTCVDIWKERYSDYYNSSAMIERHVRKMGINRENNWFSKQKVKLNHDYFETIDTQEKAYFLGFITADGNLSSKGEHKKVIQINVNSVDDYILEKMIIALESNKKVYRYTRKDGRKTEKISLLTLNSEKMFNDLINSGLCERKSFNDFHMADIDESLFPHYLRGFFDGDGYVGEYTPKNQNLSRLRFSICVNNTFGQEMQNYFIREKILVNKVNSNLINYEKYGSNIHHLRLNSIDDIYNVYTFMYKDAIIYMDRKKSIFDNFFKNRDNMTIVND